LTGFRQQAPRISSRHIGANETSLIDGNRLMRSVHYSTDGTSSTSVEILEVLRRPVDDGYQHQQVEWNDSSSTT